MQHSCLTRRSSDLEGANCAVREPVLGLAGARHLLVFYDLPRLADKFGDARLALSFGGHRAVAFGLLHPRALRVALDVARLRRPLAIPRPVLLARHPGHLRLLAPAGLAHLFRGGFQTEWRRVGNE